MKPTKSEELAKSTLEVLSLKSKYYHSDQRVALQLLHASDPRSDDLPKKSEHRPQDADRLEIIKKTKNASAPAPAPAPLRGEALGLRS